MKVRAMATDAENGYINGDIIEVTEIMNYIYIGENLTSKHLLREKVVRIGKNRCEVLPKEKRTEYVIDSIKEYKLFGITVFKKIKKSPVEVE